MLRQFIVIITLVLLISGWVPMTFAAETRRIKRDEIQNDRKTPITRAQPQIDTHQIKQPKPNLTIIDMEITPPNPQKGQTILFTAKVLNKGLVGAPWHQAAIRVGGETHPPPISVHALAPSATKEIKRQLTINRPGIYRVTFIGDMGESVPEMNENDNTNYLDFRVRDRLPDLTLVDPGFSPAKPRVGDAVRVEATAKNIGDVTAYAFHTGIRAGGQTHPSIIGSIGHMDVTTPQGQKYVVARQWYPTKPGTYIVRLYIDVNDAVKEHRESNNVVRFRITVAP